MARCGCGGTGSCTCSLIAGDNIDITGAGSSENPYIITGSASVTTVLDSTSVDFTLTGTGAVGDPYVISATVVPREVVNEVIGAGATEMLPDITVATVHRLILNANLTLTFPTAAAGKSFTVELVQDVSGAWTVTWPASVRWPSGAAPTITPTAFRRDVISFLCTDGSTWLGFVAGQDYAA